LHVATPFCAMGQGVQVVEVKHPVCGVFPAQIPAQRCSVAPQLFPPVDDDVALELEELVDPLLDALLDALELDTLDVPPAPALPAPPEPPSLSRAPGAVPVAHAATNKPPSDR